MDTRSTIQMLRDAADAFEAGGEQDEASAYDARALYLEGLLANWERALSINDRGLVAARLMNEAPADARPAAAPVEAGPVSGYMDQPECPGSDCLMCSGEACDKCGAGCWNNQAPFCEHDSAERHEYGGATPEPGPTPGEG